MLKVACLTILMPSLFIVAGCPEYVDQMGDDDIGDDDEAGDDDTGGLTDCLYYRDADADGYGAHDDTMLGAGQTALQSAPLLPYSPGWAATPPTRIVHA